MSKVKRFYYQHLADGLSDHFAAWQVYDRQITEPNGETGSIAKCRNRHWAETICAQLNEAEA